MPDIPKCVAVILPRVQGAQNCCITPAVSAERNAERRNLDTDEFEISDNWIGMLSSSIFTGMMIGAWSWGSCEWSEL